jgi:hypothetical protein
MVLAYRIFIVIGGSTVAPQQGGLEGCKPSKNLLFPAVAPAQPAQRPGKRIFGEAGYPLGVSPNPSTA